MPPLDRANEITQDAPLDSTLPDGPWNEDAPPRNSYLAGELIAGGKYQLSKIIGEGGMGSVWLAKNLALDADVAIKLIRRGFASEEAAQRLQQEARAAARLGHPSIVRIFDFGQTESKDPFIVMEVLSGESLGEILARKGKLSPVSAVRTLLPVVSALSAAHGKGIVHRDLKPDNVLLVKDESGALVPKVVDFGIAKLHREELNLTVTQAGAILGSPSYMSPEQACGRSDVDQRTDVWALCVMLYEAVAGVRPFDGPNYNALLGAIILHEPAPLAEHGVADAELWEIVARGLQKDVDQRWQSMRDLGAELAGWAVRRGADTDAAGNSLKAHWLKQGEHRPLSDVPPPISSHSPSALPPPRLTEGDDLRPPRLPTDLTPEMPASGPRSGVRAAGENARPKAPEGPMPSADEAESTLTSSTEEIARASSNAGAAPRATSPARAARKQNRSALAAVAVIAAVASGLGVFLGWRVLTPMDPALDDAPSVNVAPPPPPPPPPSREVAPTVDTTPAVTSLPPASASAEPSTQPAASARAPSAPQGPRRPIKPRGAFTATGPKGPAMPVPTDPHF
ncbi:serine/threonine-protein kinase [Polyangium aurulentum]|uniref:serine/threonine-protein kinase n=1 Tax=Polyangium aurulentum TaxID=2567896 RepID=UPI00146CD3E0|nr:serine/threonine-protein kinase [Polyangium aurulentum]UQA57840.1 protein kinase [Polyangium aurulentum]